MKIDPQSFLLFLTSSSSSDSKTSALIHDFLEYADNPGKPYDSKTDEKTDSGDSTIRTFTQQLQTIINAWGGEPGEAHRITTFYLHHSLSLSTYLSKTSPLADASPGSLPTPEQRVPLTNNLLLPLFNYYTSSRLAVVKALRHLTESNNQDISQEQHSQIASIALKRLSGITKRRALTPLEVSSLSLPSPITEGNTVSEITSLIEVLETSTLILPPPATQIPLLVNLHPYIQNFFPPSSSPLDVLLSASLTGGKDGNLNSVLKSDKVDLKEWLKDKNLPLCKMRLGCLIMLDDEADKSSANSLITSGNSTGFLPSLLTSRPNNPLRPLITELVYTLYLSPTSTSTLTPSDLKVLCEVYSLTMGSTNWSTYPKTVSIGCYLLDSLRCIEPLPVLEVVMFCEREGVKVEEVVGKERFVGEVKNKGGKEVWEVMARLAEKDESTRRTFRVWFEHPDEGILLPTGPGLPNLLKAIDARNEERWGRKARECYQTLKTSPTEQASCLLLIPILLSVDPSLAPSLFSTCVDVLITLSTTPQNYNTLTLCFVQMRTCLLTLEVTEARRLCSKSLQSPKLIHALSSSLTFPVTTALKGSERIGHLTPKSGWDLTLGALGSSSPDIARGALKCVNCAVRLWEVMAELCDTGGLAKTMPGINGELDVSYSADSVADVLSFSSSSISFSRPNTFTSNSSQSSRSRPRVSTLGLIANYTLGGGGVKGAWNVIKGVMEKGGVSVADLVDVHVLIEGVKDALKESHENCEAVDFLKSAVEGNYDVAALILSDPKICGVLLWTRATPLRVASSCASIIATVWESPPHSALSSCVPPLLTDPELVPTLIKTVVEPLPPYPDVGSSESEVDNYATLCSLKSSCIRAVAVELWRGGGGSEGRKTLLDNFENLTREFMGYSPALLSTPPGHVIHEAVTRYAASQACLVKSWGIVVTSFLGKLEPSITSPSSTSPGRKRSSSGGEGSGAMSIDRTGMITRIADVLAHASSTSSGFDAIMSTENIRDEPIKITNGGGYMSSATLALLPPPPPSTYNGALVAVEVSELLCSFVAHSPSPEIFVPLESACRLLFKDTEMARRNVDIAAREGAETGERIASEISQRLRLRLLTVALATVNATGVEGIEDDDGVRSRMVTVCCGVLSSGSVSSSTSSSMDLENEDKKIDERQSTAGSEAAKLFEVTVALLTSLLPQEEGPYAREYVQAIKRGTGVENMLRWVGSGENAWSGVGASVAEGTGAVVNFLRTASASSADVAMHLNADVGVCRALCNGLGGYKGTCEHRGYVVVLKNDEKGGLGGELSYKKSFVADPSFGVWIDVIKAVSCGVSAAGDNPGVSVGAVEFLCQYAELFLKCLGSAIPTNGNKFTVQGLLEISAICDLLSVLASSEEGWKRVKEMGGVGDKLIASIINVTRDLCCFLGSSVIARQILGSSGQTPTSRHEAISYAHSASSSILAVTPTDQSDATIVAGGPRASGSGAAFDSVFHRKIEELASSALLHCVAAITRSHPANRSYVGFTVEESSMLDLTSCVKVGSMVGVRFGGGSGVGGGEQLGEVVGKNDSNNTIDVRFGESVDNNIPAFRVCGVEDSALRKPVMGLSSGGNGVDEIWKGELCIGHLGLAVRWCKGFWLNSENRGKAGLDIKGLAERLVVLLACELGLGGESSSLVGADEKLCMMIFSLFGDGGQSDRARGGGRGSSGPPGGVFGSGMQALLGRDCFDLVGGNLIEFFKQGVAMANAEALSRRGGGGMGMGMGMGGGSVGAGRSRSASSIGGIWDLV
ncbi:hypothetical protein TrST_g7749 [Triparma strigata]|uniref:Uncharacterized protein n=1 Tax=Triparma strigata TaxID=1606541 RepID=A0A9W7EX00_9STRA|nr:hypothetical protein TrST_g7749 [Triparma strigata]